jgi:hypothetical protein
MAERLLASSVCKGEAFCKLEICAPREHSHVLESDCHAMASVREGIQPPGLIETIEKPFASTTGNAVWTKANSSAAPSTSGVADELEDHGRARSEHRINMRSRLDKN